MVPILVSSSLQAVSEVGDSWEVPSEIMDVIEEFMCALYGKPRVSKVNEVRYLHLQAKCGVALSKSSNFDLSSLPPCESCLQEHVNRANYQVGIWKRVHIPDPSVPDPVGENSHGWESKNGVMQPKWTSDGVLPTQLFDILDEQDSEDEMDSESDDDEQ